MANRDRTPFSAWSLLRPPEDVASELLRDEATPVVAHVEDASRRARELGIDLGALLGADADQLAQAAFPTADCLTPTEVDSYWVQGRELAQERQDHVDACRFCTAVLRAAEPSEAQFEGFLDEVGSVLGRAVLRGRGGDAP